MKLDLVKLAWSAFIIGAPVVLYFTVIKPRLKARFTDLYADVDSFWGRVWARLYAFRTWAIGVGGLLLSELPALLDMLNLVDTSSLPTAWQATIRGATILGMLATRAYATKPREEPT